MKKRHHALIIADVEGIVDIYDLNDIKRCTELYTKEIQVYIETLLCSGVRKITICDVHNEGNLISPAICEMGKDYDVQVKLVSKVDGLSFQEDYDFAFLVGFHGMERSPGILSHTLRFDFKSAHIVNQISGMEIPVGEVEIYTRWLGSHGIPVALEGVPTNE